MSALRGVGGLARALLIETLRSRTAVFWSLAFPLLFLLIFGFVFSGGTPRGTSYLMPGLLTITVVTTTFFGVSNRMVTDRETGVLRRYRVTPVTVVAVVLAYGPMAAATLSASLLLQAVAGRLIFHVTVSGSLATLVVVLLAGELAFIPLGLFVGSVARDTRTAPAITNLIVFPMMFLSGVALPFFLLPGWIQRLARLLPATYLVEALQGVIVRGDGLARRRAAGARSGS